MTLSVHASSSAPAETSPSAARPSASAAPERPGPWLTPRVDVLESATEYLVLADVPGVSEEGLEVRFENGHLFLQARRAAGPDGAPVHEERRAAGWRRTFTVPRTVDARAIEARLAAGVLEVKLPKAAAAQPRSIPVRAG